MKRFQKLVKYAAIAFGLYLAYFMIKDNVYLNIIAIPFVFVVITLIIGMLLYDMNKKEKKKAFKKKERFFMKKAFCFV